MRFNPTFLRRVLAAAALLMAACASHEKHMPPPRPNGPPGGLAASPDGQRPGPGAGMRKPPPPRPPLSADEMMKQADADKNGALSRQEQLNFAIHEADTRFARMDRDRDGRLSSQELGEAEKRRQQANGSSNGSAAKGGPPHLSPKELLERADVNRDGAVDQSENRALAQQQASRRFQAGDRNGDGSLASDEIGSRPRQMPGQ